MNFNERINRLIDLVEIELRKYIKLDHNLVYRMYDPLTHEIIKEHYGDTHYCAASLIRSIQSNDTLQIEISRNMLNDILDNIDQDSNLQGYHNDFNLFALCISYDYLEKDDDLSIKIREKVMQIKDSNHLTTNWLPMRIFVNFHRYNWTQNNKYLKKCNKLVDLIDQVTYKDGIIDDKHPKGLSYNMQYNVATVASLLFTQLNSSIAIHLDDKANSIIDLIFPDGDINYFGRGTNQIFAWGMWIYLLSSSLMEKELDLALNFLEDQISEMLSNKNIFLNKRDGNDKYMWWDYHYTSVYTSHLYLWLVLSVQDIGEYNLSRKISETKDSGIKISKNNQCHISIFSGRKEYLAEQGPSITGIWTKRHGIIKKGYFGPWGGAFGNKYIEKDVTLKNFIGLLQIDINKEYFIDRVFRKLGFYKLNKKYQKTTPDFSNILTDIDKEYLHITFISKSSKNKFMNFPFYINSLLNINEVKLYADNKLLDMNWVGKIEDQYGLCDLYQSKSCKAKKWELVIQI